MSIWDSGENDAGGALTEEEFFKGVAAWKRRWDWGLQNPHGTKNNPHLVHPRTKERGYGRCVECGEMLGTPPKEES